MGEQRVKIRYTLRNYRTKSIITGTIMMKGRSFHEVCDSVTKYLNSKKVEILKDKAPGEDPLRWEVNGFQDYREWHRRVRNAREAMDAAQ